MDTIIEEVKAERVRQDAKWGGAEHDDKYTATDWGYFIWERTHYRAYCPEFRRNMLQIAALAIAAIEANDRSVV